MPTTLTPDANLTLSAAAELPDVSVNGRRPHATTLHRWATRGRRGVQLRTRVIGGVRVTTSRWVAEFIEAVTAAANKYESGTAATPDAGVDDELDRELT